MYHLQSVKTVEYQFQLSRPGGGGWSELVEVGFSTVFLTGGAYPRLPRIMHPTREFAPCHFPEKVIVIFS